MEVASRDVSVEDSLYETVKEIKDTSAQPCHANGTLPQPNPDEPPPPALVNGHPSPCTPERMPLCEGVEYASVDLRKKSRHSADMEAKRRSDNAPIPSRQPVEEAEEDPPPPPVPKKVLDENDNQPVVVNGVEGAGLHNGEVRNLLPIIILHIKGKIENTILLKWCFVILSLPLKSFHILSDYKTFLWFPVFFRIKLSRGGYKCMAHFLKVFNQSFLSFVHFFFLRTPKLLSEFQ